MNTGILRGVLVALLLAMGSSHLFAQRNLNVAPAATEQRVALVIGNSTYKEAPLRNPANDATDMAATLRSLGFAVTLKTNADTRQMRAAIREFAQNLKRGGVGLFYFAGHGVQSRNGRNYLIPVGADLKEEFELEDEAVDANRVLAGMEEAGNRVNIVILDACRNNPFARSWRSAVNGLAQMSAPTGSFVGFATAPGQVAADGSGRNGLYTKHLLENLKAGDPDIDRVFTRVTAAVAKETGNKQVPWKSSSLTGDFYFRSPAIGAQIGSVAPSTTTSVDPSANDRAFWDSVKNSKSPEEFKAYLDQFPRGLFAALAQARLKALQATQVATAAPSAQTLAPTAVADDLQRLAAGTVFRDCVDCPEMVAIPRGNYAMGGSRAISIPRAFAVGKFEVTFAQWDACVAAGGCTHKPSDQGWGRGSRPVMSVSWDDAKQYTAWLTQKSSKSYRLLTEAEWEYAARAGTTTAYYWGDSDTDICQYASVDKGGGGCGTYKTSPVGERRPNAFGLHDMLGNVGEWTEDCWNSDLDDVPKDGSARTTGECSLRAQRGGSWYYDPYGARLAARSGPSAGYRGPLSGFRVARFGDTSAAGTVPSVQVAGIAPYIAASRPVATLGAIDSMAPGTTFRECEVCPEMLVIPAGSFTMGSPKTEADRRDFEGPQHEVRIPRTFAAGKYEVIFDEWDACVRENACPNASDSGWGRGRRPVINVSWNDAKQYTEWLSRKTGRTYRLLSEAQWEYVARAGTSAAFLFGNQITPQQGNYGSYVPYAGSAIASNQGKTVPAGSYPANAFGLHDVHGNVSEWTEDCWNDNYNGAPIDGSAWTSGDCGQRVLRGGSWGDNPARLRAAHRSWDDSAFRFNLVGFRVARID